MKMAAFVVALLTFACVSVVVMNGQRTRGTGTDSHSEWVGRTLVQIESIKVGMTRKDLQRLFTAEAGFSSRQKRTYVFNECPYIKIDVEFQPATGPRESMDDKIRTISKPYLARRVLD